MALTIWSAAKSNAPLLTLREQASISVTVLKTTGGAFELRWKREKPDGTWPTDAQSVLVATLTKNMALLALQQRDGSVLFGDGISKFWRPKTNNPTEQSQFSMVSVIL